MNLVKLFQNLNKSLLKKSSADYSLLNSSFIAKNSTFKYSELEIDLQKTKPDLPDDPSKLVFGHKFTDHMLTIEWTEEKGWKIPKIGKFKNLEIHPAAKCLHYSIEVFEGMKAYYAVDGSLRLFRPDLNLNRLQKSSLRSSLPEFNKEELLSCIKKLVSIERDWIPKSTAASLYLRPTFIGTEPHLGVSSSNTALLYVICSPTGPYYPTGYKPISLYADPSYVRAFPGGVGDMKVGSNYGPTIHVWSKAKKVGCQQVLWLLGDKEYLTEVGTMNIFLVVKNKKGEIELVTPPLDGTILPGITRQSILDMARDSGDIKVSERRITMKETQKLLKNNELLEIFGTGTACVVCPVDTILYKNNRIEIPTMTSGAIFMTRFAKELNDIQYGKVNGPPNWSIIIDS